jgi:hypothetical protein
MKENVTEHAGKLTMLASQALRIDRLDLKHRFKCSEESSFMHNGSCLGCS